MSTHIVVRHFYKNNSIMVSYVKLQFGNKYYSEYTGDYSVTDIITYFDFRNFQSIINNLFIARYLISYSGLITLAKATYIYICVCVYVYMYTQTYIYIYI